MNVTDERLDQLLTAAVDSNNLEALDRYGAEADRRRDQREARLNGPHALAAAARWYASQGIAVFPLQPHDKKPYPRSRGFKDATADTAQVDQWWTKRPDSNIGLPTGHLFDVIDIDGEEGANTRAQLITASMLPRRYGLATTGRPCSRHLYVAATGDGNAARVWPGVDYRGLGGYVVAPPSRANTGRRYDWLFPLDVAALKAPA